MAGEVQPATAEKDPIRNTSIDAGDKNPKDHVIFDGTSTDLVAVSAVEDGTSTTPDEATGASNTTPSTTPSDDRHTAIAVEEQYALITVDFVTLTPPEAANTMFRLAETAYKAACTRTHVLRLSKPRQRPLPDLWSPSCVVMLQHGKGMKSQRQYILTRLHEAERRRECIAWELGVATEKLQSRARRVEVASEAWDAWCQVKREKSWNTMERHQATNPLAAVLATSSGRRAWNEHMHIEMQAGPMKSQQKNALTKPTSAGCGGSGRGDHDGGRTIPFQDTEEIAPLATEEDARSSNFEATAAAPSRGDVTPEEIQQQLGLQKEEPPDVESRSTAHEAPSQEMTFSEEKHGPGQGEADIVPELDQARSEIDSPNSIARLYLALESLMPTSSAAQAGKNLHSLDGAACVEFCVEWPKHGNLPAFLDPSCLQPAWSVAEEQTKRKDLINRIHVVDTHVEVLNPAWDAVCSEVERLFFNRFLESSGGQAFVIHAVQDGTLEASQEKSFLAQLTEGACFDEDAQGFRRTVAHGGDWMHSSLVHEGVEQRIRVEAAEPLLRSSLEEADRRIADERGELAVIVQHAYTLAALRLQPVIRGALARIKIPDKLREELSTAFFSAALEVQRVFRGAVARGQVRHTLVSEASTSLPPLQAHIRGFLVRRRVVRKWERLLARQASLIQGAYRGHRCRGLVEASMKEQQRAQSADLHGWASLVIQRQARVWFARRAMYLKKVDVGLSSRVRELADRLAIADDCRSVSEVLSQVDKDYRTYERTIDDMKARESEMAATFVQKVLERRDADIMTSWDSFISAAVCHKSSFQERSGAHRPHPIPVTRDGSARASEAPDAKLRRLLERYANPAQARTLPSAYLRSTLPAHVKLRSSGCVANNKNGATTKGVLRTRKRQRVDSKLLTQAASDDHKDNGNTESSAAADGLDCNLTVATTVATTLTSASTGSHTSPAKRQHHESGSTATTSAQRKGTPTHGTGPFVANSASSTEHISGISRGATNSHTSGSGGRAVTGGASSCASLWQDGFAGWESVWDAERTSRGLAGDGCSRFPGSSVRQDMPSGLEENVERFCFAAFLRGHVPEGVVPTGTTAEDAHKMYLELPPSLAKIRHEQLCREASRPVAAALRSQGYTSLRQLLPPSKLEHLMTEAGAGQEESFAAADLARELKAAASLSGPGGGSVGSSPLFSPLSDAARQGMTRTPGSRIDKSNTGREGGSVRCGGPIYETKNRNKKGAPRISLGGLGLEEGGLKGGEAELWDPRRYTLRPHDWFRPPGSVVKRRWDDKTKMFVRVNNYSFDRIYRRHNPLCPGYFDSQDCNDPENWRRFENNDNVDPDGFTLGGGERTLRSRECDRTHGDCEHLPPPRQSNGSAPARRSDEIMQNEYGSFFEGMTPNARDLYQHIISDVESWSSLEDPIANLLCRAAFYVVEHPSPPTRAELAVARDNDYHAKGFRCKQNRLARPIALAGKFPPGRSEQELMAAALACEKVPMGLEALRSFVQQLDATTYDGSRTSGTPANHTLTCRPASKGRTPIRTPTNRYGAAAPDPRRTLLARRLEAAEMLARPFAVRLEADGVSNVKVLARVPTHEWGLPACLVEEAERMLGLLAARACAANHHSNHHTKPNVAGSVYTGAKHSGSGGSGGAHSITKHPGTRSGGAVSSPSHLPGGQHRRPLAFDPKFQRSAIDPFGRPPRLEYLQPFAGPRQRQRLSATVGKVEEANDGIDLPPGIWEPPPPAEGEETVHQNSRRELAKEVCPVQGVGNVIAPSRTVHDNGDNVGCLLSSPSPPACSEKESEKTDALSGHPSVNDPPLRQVPSGRGCSQHQLRTPDEGTACTKIRTSAGNANAAVGADEHPASTTTNIATAPFTCQVPMCGAAFRRASILRVHQRSHATAPEYYRLRRAPQLFRDPPPAPTEGHGAAAARFRLRTELPVSVQEELLQLKEEVSSRRRQSLLALPQLPGAAATWAGVVTAGRPFGQAT